jgi:hypothetical protein
MLVEAAESIKNVNASDATSNNNDPQDPKYLLRLYNSLAHDWEVVEFGPGFKLLALCSSSIPGTQTMPSLHTVTALATYYIYK